MTRRRLLALLGIALVAGAVAWALAGLPGPPVACLAAGCDCEAAGRRPIRQPANAWSSLALAAAGIATVIASPGRRPGEARPKAAEGVKDNTTQPGEARPKAAEVTGLRALTRTVAGAALIAAGVAAFLYHAGLTAWAARLDGVTVAVLVGTLLLHGLYRLPRGPQRKPSPSAPSRCRGRGNAPAAVGRGGGRQHQSPAGGGAAEGRGGGEEQQSPAGSGAAEGHGGGSHGAATWARAARALAPWLLVALGGLCWWLGQNEGPWCRPDSLLQAHAAWHVLAAGAIGLWLTTEKPARTGPQVLPPSTLRAGDSDTR